MKETTFRQEIVSTRPESLKTSESLIEALVNRETRHTPSLTVGEEGEADLPVTGGQTSRTSSLKPPI